MNVAPVICPTCFEEFFVPVPAASETPCEVDYDCEVCCRPMVITFEADDFESDEEESGELEVFASARGFQDLFEPLQ